MAVGGSTGRHTHTGVAIAYVLEGTGVVEHEGQQTDTLKPGAVIKDIGIHDAKNMGKVPLKVLAVYLLEEEVSPSAALD
jgi:quercetin dioxygenase-like cupin family protein